MQTNWLGVVFAFAAGMIVAFAWYQDGFLGTHWKRLTNNPPERSKAAQKQEHDPAPYREQRDRHRTGVRNKDCSGGNRRRFRMDGTFGRFRSVADLLGNDAPPAQCLRAKASEADRHQLRLSTRTVSCDVAGGRAVVAPAPIEGRQQPPARMALPTNCVNASHNFGGGDVEGGYSLADGSTGAAHILRARRDPLSADRRGVEEGDYVRRLSLRRVRTCERVCIHPQQSDDEPARTARAFLCHRHDVIRDRQRWERNPVFGLALCGPAHRAHGHPPEL